MSSLSRDTARHGKNAIRSTHADIRSHEDEPGFCLEAWIPGECAEGNTAPRTASTQMSRIMTARERGSRRLRRGP